MECPYCKAENRDGVRFCSNCGRPMPQTAGATATATSTQVSASAGGRGNSRSLTVGTPLQGGRYVIKRILGQGGMGAALLATDKRLDNKMVVIKELISESSDPAKIKEDEQNFRREVVTLAHLDHPLIPNVTDSFDENGRYFMVQEYVEGENLEERMDRTQQPMREREALICASEILDVLDYLAQQTPPIVHRDIKPANIIISTKDKRAHLVDFGIARADVARNARRKQTSALGTPGYAPPEQYQGNADPRSDLYALGATLHHLVTNRDPRNFPPFSYPPARTLNPQLSPETDRMLTRALNNDISQRFQSAAAMKREVDDILLKRFGVSGNISSYTLSTSGPISSMGTVAAAAAANASTVNQPTKRQAPPTPIPPAPPGWQQQTYQPGGIYPSPAPQRRQGGSNVGRNFLIFLIVLLLLVGLVYGAFRFLGRGTTTAGNPTATPGSTFTNGIGVTKASDGEYIGISDGSFAFDTTRADGVLKQEAATAFKAGNTSQAEALWQQALGQDSNDAEALIYLENQKVVDSGSPYINIVVGTMITGQNTGVGRDDLQGAYVAQKQYNDGVLLNGVLIRLLIANAGNDANYTTAVATQIVQAAKVDSKVVGVMGWPFSGYTLQAVNILAKAQIPMVSQTASSDQLTGISPYFFRVAPTNKAEGVAGAKYVEQKLHAKNVIVFVDPLNSYSNSLAKDFSDQFKADGNTVLATENYTVGKPGTLAQPLQDALSHTNPAPDVIYFSGYAADASTLLTDLPTNGQFAQLPVMGGDALYELSGYQSSARAAGFRLHFTSFAHPDIWDVLGYAAKKPAFFNDYPNAFDPNRQHTNQSPYGYTRADGDVILSYDATVALFQASKNILTSGKQTFTPNDLRQALANLNGPRSFQGVSGKIAFDAQGNAVDKAVLILYVSPEGFYKLENTVIGTFLNG